MATIFEDDFNSYNDGDLNEQGDWTGDAVFDIQGVLTYEGAKAVKWVAWTSDVAITKTGTARTDGRISFYVRAGQTNARGAFRLYEGGTMIVRILFRDDGDIEAYFGADPGWVKIADYVANTWYLVEAEWESVNHTYRVRVDGGSWTDWNQYNSWTTGPNIFHINTSNPTGTFYIDHIAELPYTPAAAGKSQGFIF